MCIGRRGQSGCERETSTSQFSEKHKSTPLVLRKKEYAESVAG